MDRAELTGLAKGLSAYLVGLRCALSTRSVLMLLEERLLAAAVVAVVAHLPLLLAVADVAAARIQAAPMPGRFLAAAMALQAAAVPEVAAAQHPSAVMAP